MQGLKQVMFSPVCAVKQLMYMAHAHTKRPETSVCQQILTMSICTSIDMVK